MEPLTGMLIMQGVSGAAKLFGGIFGGKDANKAARAEARAEGFLTSAKLARLLQEERIVKGQMISGAAGSGVKTGTGEYGGPKSSVDQLLQEMKDRFAEERRVVAQVGATKASAALERGSMTANQARAQGVVGAAGSLTNAFSLWAQYGKDE